ncbi:MAG: hypothetical protein RDU20_07820 [Desulfomonilaceae bacterium]|nr:hypothetical protein [Desulfomonilaceae bacterium]
MNVSVVTSVEELKASIKCRSFPTIVVEGQLAGNIVASGILAPLMEERASSSVPPGNEDTVPRTPTHEVIQLLRDLSLHHAIHVIDGTSGPQIKIHPVSAPRREGN